VLIYYLVDDIIVLIFSSIVRTSTLLTVGDHWYNLDSICDGPGVGGQDELDDNEQGPGVIVQEQGKLF
jgi:hypothetical protein